MEKGLRCCFKIRIASVDGDIFNIKDSITIKIVRNLNEYFSFHPTIIEADPFLFVHNDKVFLFYEKLHFNKKGVLMMTSSEDLETWTEPVEILREPFHLSYPNVFEYDGDIYMIPETNEDGSIRLYKASDESLTHFNLVSKLLEQNSNEKITTSFVDSCIYKKNSVFYLFTSRKYKEAYHLELFMSNSLLGPYKEHKLSPIFIGNDYGRCGGSLIEWNGKLYRPAQDCVKRYGDNIHIMEIMDLTETKYKEKECIHNLFPSSLEFYKYGGHQFNYVNFKNKLLVTTDAKEYNHYVLADFTSLIYKFKILFQNKKN